MLLKQQEAERMQRQHDEQLRRLSQPCAIEWNLSDMLAYEKDTNGIDDFTQDMTLAMLCCSIVMKVSGVYERNRAESIIRKPQDGDS